jgi:hypothetical protein
LAVWEVVVQQALEETDLAGVVAAEVEEDSTMILRHRTLTIDHRRSHLLDLHPRDMHRHETREGGGQDSGLELVLALQLAMLWVTEVATRILAAYSVQVLQPEIPEGCSVDEQTTEKEAHGQTQDLHFLLAGMKAQASDRRVAGKLARNRMK